MKIKISLITSMLVLSFFLRAQDFTEKLSFDEFKVWMNEVHLDGYNYTEADMEGDPDFPHELSYSASFVKGQMNGVSVNVEYLDGFESYKMMSSYNGYEAYKYKDHNVIYIPNEKGKYTYSFLTIELPEINACVALMASPLLDKASLEGIADELEIFSRF